MIKKLHRLWLGPAKMRDRYKEYGRRWAELNPGWEVHDWSEADLPPLINQDIYDELGNGAVAPIPLPPHVAIATQRADVAGYELVWMFGGVYVNCDMEPLRPLDGNIPADTAWACYEDENLLNNGALGAPEPHHPFWKAVIDELPKRFRRMRGEPFHKVTGPYLLTDVYRSRDWGGLFTALPKHLFNYASYMQIPIGGTAAPFRDAAYAAGAVACHHWGHRVDDIRAPQEDDGPGSRRHVSSPRTWG